MYNFYFTNKEKIKKNPEMFLIFVKRLMPRWVNGIPDSECVAIFKLLEKLRKKKKKKLILLETGSGASTLALYLHCSLYGGKMFSWDTNGSKGSFLRSVIVEAIDQVLETSVNKIWTFIPYDSTNEDVGIEILKELKLKADFCFFDSLHTLDQLFEEIACFEKISSKNFILALDDAYYQKKSKNFGYINMIRKKMNLNEKKETKENICLPFYLEVKKYLKQRYSNVVLEKNYYKKNFKKDIFFDYYKSDRNFMNKMGMEEKKKLKNRLEAFFVER